MQALATKASLILVVLTTPAAFARPGGDTALGGSSAFITDEDALLTPAQWQTTVRPITPAPAAPGPSALGPASPTVPAPTGRACVPSRPYKESTPFKVFIDQVKQEMTVHSPDFPEPLVFPVSTGGGLKVPVPGSGVSPYCAETPAISQRIVTAFETQEFEGRRDCKPEEVRGRSTLFPGNTYRSGQFGGEEGQGALMPNAIRVQGGKFIHRCTGDGCKTLTEPVSGECIRVPGWRNAPTWVVQAARQNTLDQSAISFKVNRYRRSNGDGTYTVPQVEISETLAKQMKKYGAIDVEVGPPPPMRERGKQARHYPYPTRPYCDQAMVEQAKRDTLEGKTPEGGFFNELTSGIGGIFENIFGLGGSNQQRPAPRIEAPRPPETEQQRRDRERRERREQRERDEWRRNVFGT